MKTSEFWNALEAVYGPSLGRSLVVDLHLPVLGSTASQALESGVDPERVWAALVEETGAGEEARWAHRRDPRKGALRPRRGA